MKRYINKWTIWGALLVIAGIWALNVQDWHQLWKISSAPDNVPIVAMLFLVPFFTWLGIKQAVANDRLIEQLEADPKLAKTHHRKVEPWRPGWAREVHVWPYLVRIEFLATVIVTVILFVWSITLNAPLGRAGQSESDDESVESAVVLPRSTGDAGLLRSVDRGCRDAVDHHGRIDGLSVRRLKSAGKRLLHLRQRRFALWMFGAGFLQWIVLIVIGTFIRGPGWIWFWPGQTWDHNAVVFDRNVDLHDMIATIDR